jgi:hypothetical protein
MANYDNIMPNEFYSKKEVENMVKQSLDKSLTKQSLSFISPENQTGGIKDIPSPDDFSEFQKSIPSPKDFGLNFDELSLPPSDYNNISQEQKAEKKESFLKDFFKKRKN